MMTRPERGEWKWVVGDRPIVRIRIPRFVADFYRVRHSQQLESPDCVHDVYAERSSIEVIPTPVL